MSLEIGGLFETSLNLSIVSICFAILGSVERIYLMSDRCLRDITNLSKPIPSARPEYIWGSKPASFNTCGWSESGL